MILWTVLLDNDNSLAKSVCHIISAMISAIGVKNSVIRGAICHLMKISAKVLSI